MHEMAGSGAAPDGAALGRELSTAVVLFHEAVGQRLGLSAADLKALGIILRTGPLTAGMLARHTGLTAGAVTGLVDRLERAGYVRRVPDTADRRRVLVSPVADRPTDLGRIFERLGSEMSAFMARYDEQQIVTIVDYVSRTTEVLRAQTRRLSDEPRADRRTTDLPAAGGPGR